MLPTQSCPLNMFIAIKVSSGMLSRLALFTGIFIAAKPALLDVYTADCWLRSYHMDHELASDCWCLDQSSRNSWQPV